MTRTRRKTGPLSAETKAKVSAGLRKFHATHDVKLSESHKANIAAAVYARSAKLLALTAENADLRKQLQEKEENKKTPTE